MNLDRFVQGILPGDKDRFTDELALLSLRIFTVDLADTHDTNSLMEKIAAELSFPSYFGKNWDAVLDCLSDMHWSPAQGYLLLFRNTETYAQLVSDHVILLVKVCTCAALRLQVAEDKYGRPRERTSFYFLFEGDDKLCRWVEDIASEIQFRNQS